LTAHFRFNRVCAAILFVLVTHQAGADEAADAWKNGQQAYASGQYELAVRYFSAARQAGQDDAAVYYNIAVSQYKARDYRAARETFTVLGERFPAMDSLAQYNLGLVAIKLEEPDSAATHFRNSYFLSADDPTLRRMSSTMLRRLVGDTVPVASWLKVFSLRAGFDDNVILRDDAGLDPGTSSDSPFLEVFGSLRGPYRQREGLRFDGSFMLLRYTDATEFNQGAFQAGAVYDWDRGAWDATATMHVATSTLGGDSFDRSVRLGGRLTRHLDSNNSIGLHIRLDDISSLDSNFNGIDGSRQRVDLRYRWYSDGRTLRAGITTETNDRSDPGVSPDKTGVQVDYRYAPERGWGFGAGIELRDSEYSGFDPVRNEDLVQLEFSVTRQYNAGWQVYAQFLHADNDSSDPTFSYKRNQLGIGVFRFF
jgi:Tetratricopeptide repeat